MQAYSPLTRGRKLGDSVIAEVAKKYEKTPAQVVLRWMLQQGVVAIPKSENPGPIRENAAIYNFQLDDEDCKNCNTRPGSSGQYWDVESMGPRLTSSTWKRDTDRIRDIYCDG